MSDPFPGVPASARKKSAHQVLEAILANHPNADRKAVVEAVRTWLLTGDLLEKTVAEVNKLYAAADRLTQESRKLAAAQKLVTESILGAATRRRPETGEN